MTVRLFAILCACMVGVATGQEPIEPIPETVPLEEILEDTGSSIAPCACGAAEGSAVFPNGEFATFSMAVDPECVTVFATVLNPVDMDQAFRLALGTTADGSFTASATIIAVAEPSWCDKVCDIEWQWHHGVPRKESPCLKALIEEANKETKKENDKFPDDEDKPLIDIDNGKWGTALPKECHGGKNGVHGRGKDGDWITWRDLWEMWCKQWKKANPNKRLTDADLKKALDAIWKNDLKNANPSIHPDDVDYGKTSKGKKKVMRPGGFKSCKGKGCDIGMSYKDWGKLDGPGKADAVRKKCCPSQKGPCKKKGCEDGEPAPTTTTK